MYMTYKQEDNGDYIINMYDSKDNYFFGYVEIFDNVDCYVITGQVNHFEKDAEVDLFNIRKNKLHNMNKRNLVISTHARDKNEFNDADIKQLPFEVTNDMIIEFNRTEKRNFIDKRVTVRSKKVYDVKINGEIEKCNLIAVFSLTTNRVVTVFWNLASDTHESINMSRYNKDLKILP